MIFLLQRTGSNETEDSTVSGPCFLLFRSGVRMYEFLIEAYPYAFAEPEISSVELFCRVKLGLIWLKIKILN